MDDVTRTLPLETPSSVPTMLAAVVRFGGRVIKAASAEYVLDRPDVSNGGTVVLLRALHSTIIIVALGLFVTNVFDPGRTTHFSIQELFAQVSQIAPWFGTVFAATYAALYTRFASQWTYLAGVYNQIKAAECRKDVEKPVIAEWKAGFIEDASDLHLLRKKMFASIVVAWGSKDDVRQAFSESSYGGATRFAKLIAQANAACSGRHDSEA